MIGSTIAWLIKLKYNLRFYVLAFSLLSSAAIFAYLRSSIASDQLFYIRSQQIYAVISVVFIYIAVILTPLSKLLKKSNFMSHMLFARRAIGVSAAYFALLHTGIAFLKQVGGIASVSLLPDRFKVAFALGFIAFIILMLMALTSFDKMMQLMTFKRWKQLHRFIYVAGVLIIVHVWMIGTHIVQTPYKVTALVLLGILFGLESIRMARPLRDKFQLATSEMHILSLSLFTILMTALIAMPQLVRNYHSSHHSAHESSTRK